MIILGAKVNGRVPSKSLYNRLDKSLEYIRKYPETSVILSGGKGADEDIAEAEAMREFMLHHDIDERRLIIEDRSTTTFENLKYSKEILDRIDGRKNIRLVIVTAGFHQFRSKLFARRIGFKAYGIAAKTPGGVLLKCYLREYIAVVKCFILNR